MVSTLRSASGSQTFPIVGLLPETRVARAVRRRLQTPGHVQVRDPGCRRDGFLEDLQALRIDFGVIETDPCDIAAGARQARNELDPDCLNSDPNDRYCASGYADRQPDGVGLGNDCVRVAADDLASEIGKAVGPPLSGIPLDLKVLSL